jgi:hypothetical protein
MNRCFILSTLVSVALLCGRPLLADDATTDYADTGKKFTVSVAAPWARDEAAEKARSCAIELKYADGAGDKMPPIFVCTSKPKSRASLDQIAKALVESAKTKYADQGDLPDPKTVQLDGEDARELSYKLKTNDTVVLVRAIIVVHDGNFYVCQYMCEDVDAEKRSPLGDGIFKSFKWSK